MGVKARLKYIWFIISTEPNSPEGLRHRAQRLMDKGYKKSNPSVSYLLKRAKLEEERRRRK